MYPTKMEANGRIYDIDTDYRTALACFRAINDPEITDLERGYAVQTLLLGDNVLHEDEAILNEKIQNYLRCGKEQNDNTDEIDFDYLQDEIYVKTSIRHCYNGLNLNEIGYMHWYEYNELISGLTEDTVINQIRNLRNMDPSEIKDEKERAKLIKAQERVALKFEYPKTEEEKELDDYWDKVIERS